ncbi:MAG: hypothetical protein V3W14_00250, partial [Candidatus Neomarinimicrobiota bacterium]
SVMNRYFQLVIVSLSLILLLAVGCSDRGTNAPDTPKEQLVEQWGVWPEGDHVFTEDPNDPNSPVQLRFQIRNRNGIQEMGVFIPQEAINEGKRVPLLVLLPPMFEGKSFYLDHGLLELAEEMTASGEIQPMVITALGSDQLFGGYFWGNSHPAGFYDGIIADPHPNGLVGWLTNTIPFIIDSPAKRGIGGVGMGAYGAFRAILKHPGVYSSISVSDGPLDFDGAGGNSGMINLFDDALAEQGLAPTDFQLLDSARAWPVSSMMIGGALAFSPNDTAVFYTISISGAGGGTRDTVIIDSVHQRSDSTTLDTLVVKGDMGNWDFHLPFDSTLQPYAPIWSLWMENNLDSIHDADTSTLGSPLDGINMWIATTPDARFGFYDMTQSWISTLQDRGYTPEVYNYGGYDGKPASENEYTYDLIREMLIFHSENFGD